MVYRDIFDEWVTEGRGAIVGIKVEESAINLNYKKKIVALKCLENSELQKNKLEN